MPASRPEKKSENPATNRGFYAVVEGFTTGVLETLKEALEATQGYSGAKFKRFRSREDANQYMEDYQAESRRTAPVRKDQSDSQVRRELFEQPAQQRIAVYSGECRGVFDSMLEVSRAINEGGGEYAIFDNEDDAWNCIEEYATRAMEKQFDMKPGLFVVWAGTKVGIMSQEECVEATKQLTGAKMLGPLSESEAQQKWTQVRHKSNPSFITDVYDASRWMRMMGRRRPNSLPAKILIQYCIDAIPAFSITDFSVKPAEFMILNLTPWMRQKAQNILLQMLIPAHLKGQAARKYYDWAVQYEIRDLHVNGVDGIPVQVYDTTLDSPGRAELLCIQSHSAYYGRVEASVRWYKAQQNKEPSELSCCQSTYEY